MDRSPRIVLISSIAAAVGCSSSPAGTMPPPPGFGTTPAFSLKVLGTVADGLMAPRGLAFAPEHPEQLWTVNMRSNGVVIYFDPGAATQRFEARVDRYAQHFMSMVSSISFGEANHFATCQESRDDWNDHPQPTDDFMGPTLWTADLDVFAQVGQAFPHGAQEGSHIDMLHESPLCMGIAHDDANVFWAFDGLHGHIVRYDFVHDHGPGGSAHSDGKVRRYVEAQVTRTENVASQLAFDHDHKLLYIADTGAGRITRLDTRTGSLSAETEIAQKEALAEYSRVTGTTYDVVAEGLGRPSGLVLSGDVLYYSDFATGDIVSLDLKGHKVGRIATGSRSIMGLTIGPDGKLYFVDTETNTLVRVDDGETCSTGQCVHP